MTQRPAAGQPESLVFERLYAEWSDPVWRYIVHLVGPGAVSEDLFQEAWLQALKFRAQLRDPEKFGSWIYRIARNLAFNHKRQFGRQTQIWIMSNLAGPEDAPFDNWLEGVSDERATPDQRAEAGQRREVLLAALAEMDTETQEMLQLRYFEQLTLAQVAEVMGMPLGTVCARVHRALKVLQRKLVEQGITTSGQL